MVGITAYGAYVPLHRLGRESLGWTSPTEKAVANYDEDSVTMATAAANNCLEGVNRSDVQALYFASTTSPYKEKLAAATVVVAADLDSRILAMDFSDSIRAGTMAMRAAIDAVKAGSAKQVLVAASDLRIPVARSEFETVFGDGAAAILIGDIKVAVEVEDGFSVSDEILDIWRAEGDTVIRSWEDRFVTERGYLRVLPDAVSQLMKKHSLTPKDFTTAVFYAPDARKHTEMARRLGFDIKTQVQEPLFNVMGNTGTAFALMMLIAALEKAKAGDRILFASYGNGADAFLLRVTEEIDNLKQRRGVQVYLQSKEILDAYQTYTRWRGLIDIAPAARRPAMRTPAASAMLRERDKNIRFYGVKCKHCGYPQYPPLRVCTMCHTKDEFEPYKFADKKANVFTYSMDYLGPTLDPPLIIAVTNYEGGGRFYGVMADCDPDKLQIGMPVEMTFRKLYSTDGIHNYFWKCMPVRA